MATALGAITTGVGLLGQKQAGQQAADTQIAATEANIAFLEQSGQEGAADIERRKLEALKAIQPGRAAEPIQRFADVGTQAFTTGRQQILGGDAGTPIARAIAQGGVAAAEGIAPTTGPVRRAVIRRARMGGETAAPQFQEALLGMGTQAGLGGVTDIAGLQLRGSELAGDIARQAGAGQASALIGQAPEISRQIQTGQEARALGQAAQTGFQTGAAENIAQLLGRQL